MDKRQNSYEGSAGQAKSFAKGAGLARDWRQSIAIPASMFILPRRSSSLRFLLRLFSYFRLSILLNFCALLPVRASNALEAYLRVNWRPIWRGMCSAGKSLSAGLRILNG
jgi:hypothetical protein